MLDDATDWIVVGLAAVAMYGLMFALARRLLNIGFGPK